MSALAYLPAMSWIFCKKRIHSDKKVWYSGLNAANMLTKHVEVGVLKTYKGIVGMIKCG